MEAVAVSAGYFQTAVYYPLLVFAVILAVTYLYIQNCRVVRFGNKMPGPPTVPILGNALLTLGVNPNDVLDKLLEYDIYGNVVRAFLGTKLVVFISDPRDIEIILSSSVHIEKANEYRYFKPWLGDGLLISTGEKWRSHRKIIAPTFHLNVLKTFVPLFYENSRDLVMRLRSVIGKEFDCHDYLSAVTVDILLETAMGIRGKEKERTGYDYAMAVMKMCDIIHRRQYNAVLRLDSFFKFTNFAKQQEKLLNTIHSLTTRVIRKKKEEFFRKICSNVQSMDFDGGTQNEGEENEKATVEGKKEEKVTGETDGEDDKGEKRENITEKSSATAKSQNRMRYVRDDLDEMDDNDVGEKRRLAFLDLMLELARNGAKLSDEEIKEEVDTIMFEGHDTTAAGSSFVLCVLGTRQDIQDRVYEELYGIFGDSGRQCTFQDTLEMKYLERVIMETLRMFPPVPAIARKLNEDVKLVTQEYVLPRDCTVIIPPYKVHRLEEYYANPEVFDPDNFLPERTQNRHYYAFIPFSAGPRSCVGRKYAMLKLKVLLSTILRSYRIQSDLTEKDFRLRVDIILKRSDGFRIKIEPRNRKMDANTSVITE